MPLAFLIIQMLTLGGMPQFRPVSVEFVFMSGRHHQGGGNNQRFYTRKEGPGWAPWMVQSPACAYSRITSERNHSRLHEWMKSSRRIMWLNDCFITHSIDWTDGPGAFTEEVRWVRLLDRSSRMGIYWLNFLILNGLWEGREPSEREGLTSGIISITLDPTIMTDRIAIIR